MNKKAAIQFQEIFKDEAIRGEKSHWKLHWFLYGILLLLSMVVYFVQKHDVGMYGILLSVINLLYNFSISWFILKKKIIKWNGYVMVSLNIITLGIYNYLDAYYNSSLVPVTTATLLLYPVIIFLASLRMDKVLIIWATLLSIFTIDGLYIWFYPSFDQNITSQLISVDILGQVYRSVYLALCGVLMYTVPQTMLRILRTQERLTLESLANKQKAQTDPLTGAYNRLYFEQYLLQTLQLAQKFNFKVAVFFIDLDGFKDLNDTYGHDVGDFILKSISENLTSTIRSNDIVARVGGDEFVVVMSHLSEEYQENEFGNRILDTICIKRLFQGHELSIGASIGISIYPDDATSLEQLVKYADEAMYQAKKEGKNGIRFFKQL